MFFKNFYEARLNTPLVLAAADRRPAHRQPSPRHSACPSSRLGVLQHHILVDMEDTFMNS